MTQTKSATRVAHAFTTIELLLAIGAVIAIAVVSTFAFGNLRQYAANKALLADMDGIVTQVRHYKDQTGHYPTDDTDVNRGAGFSVTKDTTYEYTSAASDQFCTTGYRNDSAVSYYVSNKSTTPKQGICPGHYSAASKALMRSVSVGTFVGSSHGYQDGTGTSARFGLSTSYTIGIGPSGSLYIGDTVNNRIRKVSSAGVVTTLAGSGACANSDNAGTAASFCKPGGTATDLNGTVYVISGPLIRKITRGGSVSTLAGSTQGHTDGAGVKAQFNDPAGIAVDPSGNLYVTELSGYVRKVTPSGAVSTLAGNGTIGYADGEGAEAIFNKPTGIAADSTGTLYLTDTGNNRIRKVSPSGTVSTVAGSGKRSFADGTAGAASFAEPYGITTDPNGTLYVADTGNYRIRKITSDGTVTTVAGTKKAGSADGAGNVASFTSPNAIGRAGNGMLYILDSERDRIRSITF